MSTMTSQGISYSQSNKKFNKQLNSSPFRLNSSLLNHSFDADQLVIRFGSTSTPPTMTADEALAIIRGPFTTSRQLVIQRIQELREAIEDTTTSQGLHRALEALSLPNLRSHLNNFALDLKPKLDPVSTFEALGVLTALPADNVNRLQWTITGSNESDDEDNFAATATIAPNDQGELGIRILFDGASTVHLSLYDGHHDLVESTFTMEDESSNTPMKRFVRVIKAQSTAS